MTEYIKQKIARDDFEFGSIPSDTFLRNEHGVYVSRTKLVDPLIGCAEYPAFGGVDGISDQVQINMALEKWGYCNLLKNTEYIIDGAILLNDNQIFVGFDNSSVLKAKTGFTGKIINTYDSTNGNSNILLKNFKINGNDQNCDLIYLEGTANSNIDLLNITVDYADKYGIYIENIDRCNLLNCISTRCLGILLLSASNYNIMSCYDDNVGVLNTGVTDPTIIWF